jgi:hypothetical protein
MIKLTKEYLSLLQCLLYKAQKREKRKQILKFQKIFYKSKSIIFFILSYKTLKKFEAKKVKNYLSESIFENIFKICILKKQIQIFYFLNSKLKFKNKLVSFRENFHNISSSILFLESKNKQIFSVHFVPYYHNIKLSYLSLRHFKFEYLSFFHYSNFLSLPTQNLLLFYFNNKKKQHHIHIQLNLYNCINYLKLGTKYQNPLFHYQTFHNFYFYHHNYFLDDDKIKYQNTFYFHLLSNRKQQFFLDNKQKQKNININKKTRSIFGKNCFINYNYKNSPLKKKNNNSCYYSTILNYPYFRQNSCFSSSQLLVFFYNTNKMGFLEIQLSNIQKQILLFILEPIWEAYFEIASYSHRRGRSLYDAIEFFRSNLKKQPMFLFKIYLKYFYKTKFFKSIDIKRKRNFKKLYTFTLHKKRVFFDKFHFLYNKMKIVSLFFCFFENIIYYGIQKKYQNYYLRTKQQIFLYQILKIFRQNNKKNNIYFLKIFYNKYFSILTIQNKIKKKIKNNKLINNYLILKLGSARIINYKKFIIDAYNCRDNIKHNQVINLKSKNYLLNNFLIFSLNNFFFEKINNLKQRLFLIELYKQKFPFDLKKSVSTFFPLKNNSSKIKGISFSIIFKDSNFFVSKNNFLFFFVKKNKKLFLNLLNYWNKEHFCFLKKKKQKTILLKNLQLRINIINKIEQIFVFSTKNYPVQWNYQILLKINLFFICGFFNSLIQFLNLVSFHNIFLIFLLFVKNIFFYSFLKKSCSFTNFFFIMYYSNFYVRIFSFFPYKLKKKIIVFLLKKNNVKFIWNILIKYENQIIYFNSNYNFLKSFQTILKKWMIFNKISLFIYIENTKIFNISRLFYRKLYSKSFLFHYDWIIFYLKQFLNGIVFINLYLKYSSNKRLYLKKNIKKERNFKKANILWSLNFFITKEKHTFLFYKKKFNGFSFFNFFMYHTNNNTFILNYLFFWQFYFIQILKHFKYIFSFMNYYQIYFFIIQKEKICTHIYTIEFCNQIIEFHFFQSLFLKFHYSIFVKYNDNNFLRNLINFSSKKKKNFSSFRLFYYIFSKIIKNKYTLIFYKKLMKQQILKIDYYFSIKPSKYNIQRHLFQIHTLVKKNHNKTQEYIIYKLSKTIKNWCFYYQIITPTIFYKYINYLTLQILWRWACKRHNQKSKKWIKIKYFYKLNLSNSILTLNNFSFKNCFHTQIHKKIVFASKINFFMNLSMKNYQTVLFRKIFDKNKKDIFPNFSRNSEKYNFSKINKKIFICLPNHTDIILIQHNSIQNDRSPFDGNFIYWIPRNFYD